MTDSIVNELVAEHLARAEKGERKYGVTLDRDDLGMSAWLKHLCEELMDAALYAKKAQQVYAAELNRRAEIEQVMLDAATGKRPMPDADTLRLWALALGTPKKDWSEQIKQAVRRKR